MSSLSGLQTGKTGPLSTNPQPVWCVVGGVWRLSTSYGFGLGIILDVGLVYTGVDKIKNT